jgi:hypothetical protein
MTIKQKLHKVERGDRVSDPGEREAGLHHNDDGWGPGGDNPLSQMTWLGSAGIAGPDQMLSQGNRPCP